LEKEALYPGDRFRMSDEVLDAYVRQLLEAHADTEVTVAWQGGEPTLMGVGFFRRALEACERHRRPGQSLTHTIQTNGTLLTDEFCRLFARARVLGRDQHRRAGGAPRRLPGRQEGQPDV
jgi:uncharacterized protein